MKITERPRPLEACREFQEPPKRPAQARPGRFQRSPTPPWTPLCGISSGRPTPPPREPTRAAADKPPPGPLTQLATQMETWQQDLQAAREIFEQVSALRRLTDAKIQAMMADLSTQIFQLWQDVMVRRQKAYQDALDKWNKVLFDA